MKYAEYFLEVYRILFVLDHKTKRKNAIIASVKFIITA